MNILPKKRWHVRTKDNIARVRRDEAKAAEEAKELEKRIKLADQEARTSYLRKKAQERKPQPDDLGLSVLQTSLKNEDIDPSVALDGSSSLLAPSGHVNFFQHLEDGESNSTSNKERENEEKKEKEEYEKKIGLLTYLGQDTEELTGEKSWWQKIPEKREVTVDEDELNNKQSKHLDMLDPLSSVRMHLGCKGVQKICEGASSKLNTHLMKKKKRKKYSSSDTSDDEKNASKQKSSKRKDKKKKRSKKHLKDSKRDIKRKSSKHKRKRKRSNKVSSSDESDSKSDDNEKCQIKRLKHSNDEKEKQIKLERLRKERIEREQETKARKNELLYGVSRDKNDSKAKSESSVPNRKYNSQFNPQYAKQNKLDASQKYWLQ